MPRPVALLACLLPVLCAFSPCGGSSHDADCEKVCEKEIAQGCPNFETNQATCAARCREEAASCSNSQVVDDYLSCLLDKPMKCGEYSGTITTPECQSQGGAFLACVLTSGADAGSATVGDAGTRVPVQVVGNLGYVSSMAVVGDQPFWIDGNKIATVEGGAQSVVYTHTTANQGLSSLLVDATDVYFTVNVGYGASGELRRLPRAGGTPVSLFTGDASLRLLRLEGDTLWASSRPGGAGGRVLRGPKATGALVAVSPESTEYIQDVQPLGAGFYFSDERSLFKADGAGGATLVPGTESISPRSIAADGTTVYWTVSASHEIASMPLAGGESKLVVERLPEHPYGVDVDGTNLYLRLANGGLARVDRAGGQPEYLLQTNLPADEFTAWGMGQTAYFFARKKALWKVVK